MALIIAVLTLSTVLKLQKELRSNLAALVPYFHLHCAVLMKVCFTSQCKHVQTFNDLKVKDVVT